MRFSCPPVVLLALCCAASAQAPAPQPIGQVFASDAVLTGSLVLASSGMQVMSGAAIQAGNSAAVLRLHRGGEVRVCPQTGVSLASSPSGAELMFSLSQGAVEAHYSLNASADSIVTPDFRVLLPGPGEFHFALGADARGNTCVKSLPRNSASLIVSELMGSGTYQVKPGEQVFFSNGKLQLASGEAANCGCPAPVVPMVQAAAPSAPAPESLQLPQQKPNDVMVQVDAPMVFSAEEPEQAGPPIIVERSISDLPIHHSGAIMAVLAKEPPGPAPVIPPAPTPPVPELAKATPVSVAPPSSNIPGSKPGGAPAVAKAPEPAKPKGGFFKRVGSFFSGLFGGRKSS